MEMITQRTPGINASVLKIIAIVGMTLNHIGNAFIDQLPPLPECLLFLPGGLTFPIMAFLLTEGYRHTSDLKKYALRLLLFATISFFPFVWALFPMLNVLFTLLLGLVVIYLYDNMENRVGFWFAFVGITLFTTFCDWPWIGVPMVLCYHVITHPVKRVVVPVVMTWVLMTTLSVIELISVPEKQFIDILPALLYTWIGCTATIFLLLRYHGEKGSMPKYFFYIFYPGHLLVIGLVFALMFGAWS